MPDKEQAKPELSLFQRILHALSYTVDDNGYPRPDLDSPIVSDRDRVKALEALIASERAEARMFGVLETIGLLAGTPLALTDEQVSKINEYMKSEGILYTQLTPTEGDK